MKIFSIFKLFLMNQNLLLLKTSIKILLSSKIKKIKQKYYELIIFPKFINNIRKILSQNNILLRIKFEDDKMMVYYIIDNKLLKLEKQINQNLLYSETQIENIVEFIGLENIPEFLYDLKLNAEIVSSQNVIDFIFTTCKNAIAYYKLNRKEYEKIYQVILQYNNFFKFNTPALIIDNKDIKNKWID
jgi:hypothetical protein